MFNKSLNTHRYVGRPRPTYIIFLISFICIIKKKYLASILLNPNDFLSFEVVDRVSETQLQVSEYYKLNNLAI